MGTRTVQILGKAYSETGDVSIVCNFNGVEVHNGVVPTVVGVTPDQNTTRVVLFSFEVDDTLYGATIPSSFVVTGGTVFIAGVQANKNHIDDLSVFDTGTNSLEPGTKTNITVDGVLIDAVQPLEGWHYEIEDGSTLVIDWVIPIIPVTLPGQPGNVKNAIAGVTYQIIAPGSTDFTVVGSADSNPGTTFTATGPGTGSGTVIAV